MATLPVFEILGFPVSLPILVISLLAVIIIPIVLGKLLASGSKSGPSSVILLAGPRDAGKTSLLLYLQEKTLVPTQTSTTPATIKLSPSVLSPTDSQDEGTSTKPFHIRDTPGHSKLRNTAINTIVQPTESCIGVVYVIDSAVLSIQARVTETAEYLYDLLLAIQKRYATLSETSTSAESVPLLIACNKNDLFTALPSAKISNLLQAELSRMKETKRKGLLNAGAGENDDEDLDFVLGDAASDQITWEGLKEFGVDVSVQSGSVKGGAVDGWTSWMSACLDA
ncbi:hypothetical protein TWF481_009460 [Arthrobotrys musiformis]|uniref:Signal recognition particle receptor subunit beta n=1 Tax=Arthrobotrys musiformis TaxID=47236 RepID=A0AAV9W5T2_9PEZI